MIKKFIASTLIATTIVLTGCSSKAEIKAPEGYTTIIDLHKNMLKREQISKLKN